jgi:hypothetical protein
MISYRQADLFERRKTHGMRSILIINVTPNRFQVEFAPDIDFGTRLWFVGFIESILGHQMTEDARQEYFITKGDIRGMGTTQYYCELICKKFNEIFGTNMTTEPSPLGLSHGAFASLDMSEAQLLKGMK